MKVDKCPNCGAHLIEDHTKKISYCEYCGSCFEQELQERTVRVIDEARLKEASLEEAKFQAQQKEKEEQRTKEKNKNIMWLLLIGIAFILVLVGNSSIFTLLLIAVMAAAVISNSKKRRQTDVEPVYRNPIPQNGVSKKNKVTALLLCLFAGGLGIHHFYVGRIGMGILYLFTLGLFGIGIVIDLILILTGKFKDSYGLRLL